MTSMGRSIRVAAAGGCLIGGVLGNLLGCPEAKDYPGSYGAVVWEVTMFAAICGAVVGMPVGAIWYTISAQMRLRRLRARAARYLDTPPEGPGLSASEKGR
jgi:hypothetical protein